MNAERNVNMRLPVPGNRKDGRELFKVFEEVINKNNEMRVQKH